MDNAGTVGASSITPSGLTVPDCVLGPSNVSAQLVLNKDPTGPSDSPKDMVQLAKGHAAYFRGVGTQSTLPLQLRRDIYRRLISLGSIEILCASSALKKAFNFLFSGETRHMRYAFPNTHRDYVKMRLRQAPSQHIQNLYTN